MKKELKVAVSAMVLALAVAPAAQVQAQVVVDMTKVTCEQVMAEPDNAIATAIWISGFYNGKRNNTSVDLLQFKAKAEAVAAQCHKEPKAAIMQVVDTLLASQK